MSNPSTKEKKSPEITSSEIDQIEFYLFACGHGDTILLRLPGNKWALVDCFLPKRNGARKRFFKFLEEKQIQRLDFICQTHPDYDHYHGLHEVLDHFVNNDGHSLGTYFDSGLNAQQIKEILIAPKRPGAREYIKLQNSLREWDEQGEIDWTEFDSERRPISLQSLSGKVYFIPIAPDPKEKRKLTESDLGKYATKSDVKLEANALSLVLVLAVNYDNAKFNLLLAADVDVDGMKRSLEVWESREEEKGISPRFQVIKVPHHGSIKSHYSTICDYGCDQRHPKIAGISAGTRRALPDRKVMQNYLESGWSVMLTTVKKTSVLNRPGALHIRASEPEIEIEENTIRLSWNSLGEFEYEPQAAVITESHLDHYESASE